MCLLGQVQEFREKFKSEGVLPHVILAGDLNCLPDTGAVQLLLKGEITSDHGDWETSSQFAWREEEVQEDEVDDCLPSRPSSSAPSMEADESDVVESLPQASWQPGRGVSLHNPVGVLVDACAEIKCQEKYSTAKHLFARYAHMPQPFTNYVHDFRGILDR
eukprot:g24415.t1